MLQVFFGLIAFGFSLLASICLGGPLSTGAREYALLFYGGRYQVLGDLLYPLHCRRGRRPRACRPCESVIGRYLSALRNVIMM